MAALAQDYRQPEPFEVPEGGLASFLTATTGEWAEATNDDHIPETGIAGVKAVANKLAEYGRYEDEYMVHAAEGETVIPSQVLDLNPRLKAKLFKEMRDMGLEPERYVVGNELNSINPVTGQPEFFLKKLFKGLKKAVKKVVKVLKKAATVVLPIALSFTPLGPIYGAALGSGLGTLIQGGNLKDALKSALISGATGAMFKGFTGKGTFGENISQALSSPGQRFSQLGSAITGDGKVFTDFASQTAQAAGGATPTGDPAGALPPGSSEFDLLGELDPNYAAGTPGREALTAQTAAANQATISGNMPNDIAANILQPEQVSGMTAAGQPIPEGVDQAALNIADTTTAGDVLAGTATPEVTQSYLQAVDSGRNIFERAGDYLFRGGRSPAEIAIEAKRAGMDVIQSARQEALSMGFNERETAQFVRDAVEAAKESVQPDMFEKYLPSTALALAGLGAAGGFETPEFEPEMPYGGVTGYDLRLQNPGLYDPGVFRYSPVRTAAGGGDITHFPRRDGAIYGPGTETSDDIPAMLSDGEFVMTARAVRGAGNGDRERGMQRMYDIMSRFEGGAIRG